MKAYSLFFFFFIALVLSSCTDNLTDAGKSIQSSSDQISVGADIFPVSSNTIFVDSIFSRPDSLLLGTFYDTKFGTIKGEILTQVNCPVGYKFPPLAAVDSVKLVLYYSSCFGDTLAPLDLNIYELNKKTFSYTEPYPSNLNPANYTDKSVKLGQRIIRAGRNSSKQRAIEFRLDTNSVFVKQLRNDSYFASTNTFVNKFKGFYVTANFGASSLLNISLINLKYFFHYPQKITNDVGQSVVYKVNDNLTFPANNEVRQVNRVQYPDRKTVVKPTVEYNYLASPANLQTQVTIPLDSIHKKLNAKLNDKTLSINTALLQIDIAQTEQDTVLHPLVEYVLLIKDVVYKDKGPYIDYFFNNKQLPSDTASILARYSVGYKTGTTDQYEQHYTFNIATLIANELKKKNYSPLTLRLIPVAITATSTSSSSSTVTVTSVKQQSLMSAATIMSGKNTTSPMRLKIVYSGF
jgi:hypothetical protein